MKSKELSKMSIAELLQYKKQLSKIYDKLSYECENWCKANERLREELENRKIGLDILEKKLKRDRENCAVHEFEAKNNLH